MFAINTILIIFHSKKNTILKINIIQHHSDINATLVVPVFQTENNQNLHKIAEFSAISEKFIQQDFKAHAKQSLILYPQVTPQAQRLILVGLGENPDFKTIQNTFRSFLFKHKKSLGTPLVFDLKNLFELPENQDVSFHKMVDALSSAWVLAQYDLGKLKTDRKPEDTQFPEELTILVPETELENAQNAQNQGKIIAQAKLLVMELIDMPPNKIDAQTLAQAAQESGKKYNYSVRILHQKEIEENKLFALLAVNQGSTIPPTFTIAEYKPVSSENTKLPVIVLVGKGITYDTGGLSIKQSAGMYMMKCDMGGGATVFGVVEAVARLGLPVHLIGIVPATDNNVDAKSMRPSDVIDSHAGLRIEIVDTDAEGRLILADGVSYATKTYSPDILIDIATLTGASIISLGYEAAALCSNNDELAQQLSEAGDKTGDKVWRLPAWKAYRKMLDSDVADIKNYAGVPSAGTIVAAKFVEAFTHKHPKWGHLDIAAMAFGDSEYAKGKSATGYGVRLLVEYISTLN